MKRGTMSNDTYSCFAELEKAEDKKSYNITCDMKNRSSVYAIMAPHGGKIELGTTEVSMAIARDDLSLYIFDANKPNNNKTLHITSSRFDEPHCEVMLKNVETVLGIHGAADPDTDPKERVWVGGNLSDTFETHLKETLQSLGFLVEINPKFTGNSPKNICNRGASRQGMQLELTKSLREKLKDDPDLLSKFSSAVRTAMMLTYPTP
ncbi:replication protein [Salmonella enterica subsp. enterica serovar Legon]|nr:replication protein [Salmonella enterica subsp. enterica serovar Legon]PVB93475.1 replication protein [Salmonella enterica subsp. enterica serovar Legon]PVB94701.1 replication protein [Salmonella enterica subsp. enterica serovar Legon]PVC02152.1 replication protein [Salmonella enterica subsp. enterica serovar Legon]PVC06837.1 replication protein [Salmonella enterica subsp. enterica serovar Legon]